jgi:hypothetical protein
LKYQFIKIENRLKEDYDGAQIDENVIWSTYLGMLKIYIQTWNTGDSQRQQERWLSNSKFSDWKQIPHYEDLIYVIRSRNLQY